MAKKQFQLSRASLKYCIEILTSIVKDDGVFNIEISEWRDRGTDAQRRTYWMWMGEIAQWAIARGLTQEVWSGGKRILVKEWDKDFAHEFVMRYFYPKNEGGSRKSLTAILKDKGDMCHLLDQLVPWCADKGIFLTIPQKHYYWEHRNEQGI